MRILPKRTFANFLADSGVLSVVSFIRGYHRDSLRVLCYHEINQEDVDAFEAQLLYYKGNYRLITLEQLLDILVNGKKDYGRCLAVTFDDGHKVNMSTAVPLLKKHAIPTCFFLNTKLLSASDQEYRDLSVNAHQKEHEFVDADEIRTLRDSGFEIGSHTHSHPAMSSISIEEAEEELSRSKEILEGIIGDKVKFFAFPYGGKSSISRSVLKVVGKYYDAAFSTFRGFNTTDSDLHCLYRDVIQPLWPLSTVRYYIEGGKDGRTKKKMASMRD
ncbi:MAG: polysaccharide deacetylase family protein [Planctomycetes bacterium]|nr:polysaccharide deacetylase family protein [Planctomycetota bacterium]